MLSAAGSMGMIIVGLGGLGALVALVLTGLAFTKRRVPLTAWLLVPLLVIMTGAFASWGSAGTALTALGSAGPDLPELAAKGLSQAWAPDYLARWVAAVLLVFSAWGAAIGAARTGQYSLWTPFAAIMTLIVGVGGAFVVSIVAGLSGLQASAFSLAALLTVGAIGVAIASARRAYHDEAFRVAGMRFTAAILWLLGVSQASRAMVLGQRMDIFADQAVTSPDALSAMVQAQVQALNDVSSFAWIAIAVAFVAAWFAFAAELGDIVQKFTIWDAFATTALLTLLIGVRAFELANTEDLQGIALLEPQPALIADIAYDLPPGSVALDGVFRDVHFPRTGFGDAIVYEPVPVTQPEEGAVVPPAAVAPQYQWVRRWQWNGRGWDPDETPLDRAALYPGMPVLIAMRITDPAAPLLEVLERLGGEGLLLLRSSALDEELPPEAAFLQGTLLPLKLSTEQDFSTQLWADADHLDLYYGGLRVFGEFADERDTGKRFAFARSKHEGAINVNVVAGERTRISHVVELCVSSMADVPVPVSEDEDEAAEGEGSEAPAPEPEPVTEGEDEGEGEARPAAMPLRADSWCALTGEAFEAFQAAAVEAVPYEAPGNVTVRSTAKDLDDRYVAVAERELPAIGYCAEVAAESLEEGQALTGKLDVTFEVDERGRAGNFIWGEDRFQIDDADLRTCVKKRLVKARYPVVPEEEIEAAKAAVAAAKEAGEEVPEKLPGTIAMTLSF